MGRSTGGSVTGTVVDVETGSKVVVTGASEGAIGAVVGLPPGVTVGVPCGASDVGTIGAVEGTSLTGVVVGGTTGPGLRVGVTIVVGPEFGAKGATVGWATGLAPGAAGAGAHSQSVTKGGRKGH